MESWLSAQCLLIVLGTFRVWLWVRKDLSYIPVDDFILAVSHHTSVPESRASGKTSLLRGSRRQSHSLEWMWLD